MAIICTLIFYSASDYPIQFRLLPYNKLGGLSPKQGRALVLYPAMQKTFRAQKKIVFTINSLPLTSKQNIKETFHFYFIYNLPSHCRLGGYECSGWCTSMAFDEPSGHVFVGDNTGAISMLKLDAGSCNLITTLRVRAFISKMLNVFVKMLNVFENVKCV